MMSEFRGEGTLVPNRVKVAVKQNMEGHEIW